MATGGLDVEDSRPIMGGSNLFEPDDVAADDSEGEIDGMDVNIETKVIYIIEFISNWRVFYCPGRHTCRQKSNLSGQNMKKSAAAQDRAV